MNLSCSVLRERLRCLVAHELFLQYKLDYDESLAWMQEANIFGNWTQEELENRPVDLDELAENIIGGVNMQSFTKTELVWMIEALETRGKQMDVLSNVEKSSSLERSLYHLRAEQLCGLSDKLRKTIESNDHRIVVV